MTDEESYIPYLVLVRFDKDDGDLRTRVTESAPALKEVLSEIGTFQSVEMSYDGSMVAYLEQQMRDLKIRCRCSRTSNHPTPESRHL